MPPVTATRQKCTQFFDSIESLKKGQLSKNLIPPPFVLICTRVLNKSSFSETDDDKIQHDFLNYVDNADLYKIWMIDWDN